MRGGAGGGQLGGDDAWLGMELERGKEGSLARSVCGLGPEGSGAGSLPCGSSQACGGDEVEERRLLRGVLSSMQVTGGP
jgi:hypothetical protein